MPTATKTPQPRWLPRAAVVTVVAMVAAAATWWLWRPQVELNGHQYEVALALYRVCNQRSVDGLKLIEARMADATTEAGRSNPAHGVLAKIVDDAKAGRWDEAARACRQALEDQVDRSSPSR